MHDTYTIHHGDKDKDRLACLQNDAIPARLLLLHMEGEARVVGHVLFSLRDEWLHETPFALFAL